MRKIGQLLVAALLSVAFSHAAYAQRTLRGRVLDIDTGQPINGVGVRVHGTTIGALTDDNGHFEVQVPGGALTLDVRRIGYAPQSVSVAADENDITIKLKAEVLRLSQTVVTGQATSITRANAASDIAVVAASDLTHTHEQTIENALQGKVAGAVVTSNSGAPGGGLQIQMRGVTSIFGNSQPLYVVDGVPISNTTTENGLNAVTGSAGGENMSNQDNGVNRVADLNPDDIASIEILKGPSAAAIYGSSAANGVVIITTKQGAPGKPRFQLTQRLGTHVQANTLGLRRFTLPEAVAFDAGYGIDSATTAAWYAQSHGFDNFEKDLYGDKSLSYETNLSLSGGSEATQYFISGVASHDNGIMYNTGYSKQGVRANLAQTIGSKLEVKVNTNMVHTLTNRGVSNNDNVNITPYFVFAETPSFFPLRQPDGSYTYNPFSGSNPLQTINLLKAPEDLFRLMGSVDANYTVFNTEHQMFKATLNAGVDHYTYKSNIYSPPQLFFEPSDGLPGTATDLTTTETRAPLALSLTHVYTSSPEGWQATTSIGARRGYDALGTTNIVTQNLITGQQNVDRGSAVNVFENRQMTKTLALYGQEEVLLFDRRLYLEAGILGQRSTNNAQVNQFYYYPKFGGSYNWQNLGPFNYLKLRASYGETGNEPIYGQKFTSLVGVTYSGQNGLAIGGVLADPNLHPEREKEIEVGTDLGLFDSRIGLSATWYQKTNSELLLQQALAPSTGYAVRIFNGGSIRNRGVELALSGFPVRNDAFTWESRVTFSHNTGLVTSLPVPAFRPPNSFGYFFGAGYIQVGHSPSQIRGYDANGNLATLGDYQPKFVMGFSNDFRVGPFHAYALVDWRHGGDVVNITQYIFDAVGTAPDVAAAAKRSHLANDLGQSVYIQDASFVKLREVTISYQIPETLVHQWFGSVARSVRVEASGRNLATWTKYPGLDPEVSNFGNQNINRGQDLAPYPPSRSFFFTLAVGF